MVGEKNYQLLREIKYTWDPQNIFNPNKIVDTPSMNTMLRYTPGQQTPAFKTVFRYYNQDVLQHAEQCNGSVVIAERHNYRAAQCVLLLWQHEMKKILQEQEQISCANFLPHSEKMNRFDHEEIKDVMDLCLSCKGCKSECPSNVDVAKLKAEFLQHYYDANGVPFRSQS